MVAPHSLGAQVVSPHSMNAQVDNQHMYSYPNPIMMFLISSGHRVNCICVVWSDWNRLHPSWDTVYI